MLRLPLTSTLLATLLLGPTVSGQPQVVVAVAVAYVVTHPAACRRPAGRSTAPGFHLHVMAGRGQVLALPVGAAWEYRLVRLNEWVRERFWSIPVALVLAGVLTAVVVSRPDLLGLPSDWDLGHVVRIRTADTILEVMASSMLTFVGVVFAITLVGLQDWPAPSCRHG